MKKSNSQFMNMFTTPTCKDMRAKNWKCLEKTDKNRHNY